MSIDESLEDEVPTAQTTITSYCSSDVINEVMNPLIEQGLKVQKKQVSVLCLFVSTSECFPPDHSPLLIQ
uniref:DDE_Tnp_1_7 domain-containing protein n=1 Tax=Caenorhabditis tropicalis TaxID=1561998 RepID=A0A1I7U9W8_9PELO